MKKYILMLLVVLSVFTLVGCSDQEPIDTETAITALFENQSINQNSITLELTVDDPDDEITGTIYARLYDLDGNAISSRSFSKTEGDHALDAVTITFAALGLEQSYRIDVVATVERDTITVAQYEFQTIGTIHITSVDDFLDMDTYRGADYVLDNDLDFDGVDFVSPFSSSSFTGTFDGQGYTLSNIDIQTAQSTIDLNNNYYYIGVFGYVGSSALISNVVLDGVTMGSETEPQVLDNFSRVGFFAGYVSSSSATLENITVQNSHYYIETSTDEYIYAGGIVGELRGELLGATITNSSIQITTTSTDDDSGYLVKLGGAVGFLQLDAVAREIDVDVDLSYETSISEFEDEAVLKVAIGGAIGDNIAINSSNSVADIIAKGNIDVSFDLTPVDEFDHGSYALYVGGLVGNSSTKIVDGFFAGSIDVNHISQDTDTDINKQIYVGALCGFYGVSKNIEHVVWVVGDGAITVNAAADANLHVDSLIGKQSSTRDHQYGVVGTEMVIINTVTQAVTAPVIADMTDYFSSEFANDAYAEFIRS